MVETIMGKVLPIVAVQADRLLAKQAGGIMEVRETEVVQQRPE